MNGDKLQEKQEAMKQRYNPIARRERYIRAKREAEQEARRMDPFSRRRRRVKTQLAKIDRVHTLHRIVIRELGSVKKFLEYLCYSTPDPDRPIGKIVSMWNSHGPKKMTLDEVLAYLNLDPGKVYGWASEGAYRFMHHSKNFRLAEAMPGVLERNATEAAKVKGFEDRELFVKMAGFLPKGTGTQVNVNQMNENNAQAAAEAKLDEMTVELPSFDAETVASCDEMRR